MTVWAFNIPNEKNYDFVCESLKQGISRFGWSYLDSADLHKLADKPDEDCSEDEFEIWDKSKFLLNIEKGDWIVHINVPDKGKVTAGKVLSEYQFDQSRKGDFRHYFELDKDSIISFDRNDSRVTPILSNRLKLRKRYWTIKVEKEFFETLHKFVEINKESSSHILKTLKKELTRNKREMDKKLKKINHFKNFPSMMPYIGNCYGANGNQKILLIGESNYLPENSRINKNAEDWYQTTEQDLTEEEVEWINCREILECDWKPNGHMIYRELNKNLELHFKNSGNERAMSNVAYMNGFQRPANAGDSIKNFLTQIDKDISSDVLNQVIEIIKPDLVLFVSKLAWDELRPMLKIDEKIKVDFTCHPTTGGRYWHKKEYKHGRKKFNKIIKSLINQ